MSGSGGGGGVGADDGGTVLHGIGCGRESNGDQTVHRLHGRAVVVDRHGGRWERREADGGLGEAVLPAVEHVLLRFGHLLHRLLHVLVVEVHFLPLLDSVCWGGGGGIGAEGTEGDRDRAHDGWMDAWMISHAATATTPYILPREPIRPGDISQTSSTAGWVEVEVEVDGGWRMRVD